jgi:sugar-specific transcriptional regulator TrmB
MQEEIKTGLLKEVGLTEGESKVYILLLKRGSLKASQISKETGLNRSNLYKIIENLISKKLVFSLITDKVNFFSSTRPERLKELYNQKLSSLREKEKEINEYIKSIETIQSIPPLEGKFAVEVYHGIDEVKEVLSRVLLLNKNDIVYSLGKEGLMAEYPKIKYWFHNFIKQRVRKGIKFYAIYNLHEKAKRVHSRFTRVRYAKLEGMGEIEIAFYRDLLMIYVVTEKEPRVIVIKSKEIVNSMIGYFNFLWEKAKEII